MTARERAALWMSEELMMAFMLDVEAAMKEQGVSQADLATRMHCSRQYIWLLFNAKCNLSLYSAARIAQALDKDLVVKLV